MTTLPGTSQQVWKTPSFRQAMINRLDEAIGGAVAVLPRNSANIENHCFMKSNNKEEYLSNVARAILQIKNRGASQVSSSSSTSATSSFVPEMNHNNIPFPDIGQNGYPYLTPGSYPHYHYHHHYGMPSNAGSSAAIGPSSVSQRQIGQAQVPNGSVPYHHSHPSTGLHPNSDLFHCQYSQLPSSYMIPPSSTSLTEDSRQLRLLAWQRCQHQQQQNMMYPNYLSYSVPPSPSSSSDYHSYPYNQTAVNWNPQLPTVGSNSSSSAVPSCCPPVVSKSEVYDHQQSSNTKIANNNNNNNSKSNNASSERNECTICFERPIDSVYIPCGHLLACFQCAQEYRKTKNVCPICQTPTYEIYKTFTV